MPSRSWQNRIRDILEAIAEIDCFTSGMTFEQFQADPKTVRAVLYDLAIIGEAIRSVPIEIEMQHPDIPWNEARGIRNIVLHEYFRVNLAIVWQTIQMDLPQLAMSLQQLL